MLILFGLFFFLKLGEITADLMTSMVFSQSAPRQATVPIHRLPAYLRAKFNRVGNISGLPKDHDQTLSTVDQKISVYSQKYQL